MRTSVFPTPSVVRRWVLVAAIMVVVGGMLGSGCRGQELEWRGFEEALAAADSTNRFVVVAVYAPWCGWCRKMRRDVYPSEGVRRCLAESFVPTRLNRDDTETTYRYRGRRVTPRRLASTFRADGVPTTVLLSPGGEYLLHLPGYLEASHLQSVLSYVATRAYRHVSYEQYREKASRPCGGSESERDS